MGRSLAGLLAIAMLARCASSTPSPRVEPDLAVPPPLPTPAAAPPTAPLAARPPLEPPPLPLAGLPPPGPGTPTATFDARTFAIDPALARKLESGLWIDLEIFDGAQSVATCRVRYDLWDEVFDHVIPRRDVRPATTESAVRGCFDGKPTRTLTAVAR